MIPYEEYEQLIRDEAGEEFHKWKHLIPSVPVFYRSRYLLTIRSGFSMPRSFDMVVANYRMCDADFCNLLDQMVAIEKPKIAEDVVVIS